MPNVHVLFVHFPIALLVVAFALEAIAAGTTGLLAENAISAGRSSIPFAPSRRRTSMRGTIVRDDAGAA